MQTTSGNWRCALCGAQLHGDPGERPRVMTFVVAGGHTIRHLRVGDHLHCCESPPDTTQPINGP